MSTIHYLKKSLRYLLIVSGILLLLLLVLTGIIYYVAVSDQERIPDIVQEISMEELGVEASFEHYQFQYFDHFPYLSLSLKGIQLRDPEFCDPGQQLLRVGELEVVFRPWRLLQQRYEIRSIRADSVALKFYKDEAGNFNASFLQQQDSSAASPDSSLMKALYGLESFELRNFDFNFIDSARGKHHHFTMYESTLNLGLDSLGGTKARLQGDWFIHQLLFKARNGPYFRQQDVKVDLNLRFPKADERIVFDPSVIVVEGDSIHIEGFHQSEPTGYLKLLIQSDGLLLQETKPLLADNLQAALEPYEIDRPLPLWLKIEGPSGPGNKQPIRLEIDADSLQLKTNTLRFTSADMRVRYRNDCDSTGVITRTSDCLNITIEDALLNDTIPVSFTYQANNMSNPKAQVEGTTHMELVDANPYLPVKGMQLQDGRLSMRFRFDGVPADLIDPEVEQLPETLFAEGQIRDAALSYPAQGLKLQRADFDFQLDKRKLSITNARLTVNEQSARLDGTLYGLPAYLLGKSGGLHAQLQLQAGRLDLSAFTQAGETNLAPAGKRAPLPKLSAKIQLQAEQLRYQQLQIDQAFFRITYGTGCPKGPCIRVDSLSGLAYEHVPVTGQLQLDELSNPKLSLQLQSKVALPDLQPLLPDSLLTLQQGQLSLQLQYQGALQDYANLSQAALNAKLQGAARIDSARAVYHPSDYRFEQINAQLHFNEKDIVVDTLHGLLNDNKAMAKGHLRRLIPFLFDADQEQLQAELRLHSPAIDLSAFTPPRAGAPAQAESRIGQQLQNVIQKLTGRMTVTTDTLRYRNILLTEVGFRSRFTDPCFDTLSGNYCVVFDTLSGRLFGNSLIQARVKVQDLDNPYFLADASVDMPVAELNRMFAPGRFRFGDGKVQLRFRYRGRPAEHFGVEESLLQAHITGSGQFRKADFTFQPRGYEFEDADVGFRFDGEDLHFDTISLLLNKNQLSGSGMIRDFLPFIFLPEQKLDASLRVNAQKFNLNNFRAPQKFAGQTGGKAESPTTITKLVNAGLANIETDFTVDFDTVVYRNFLGEEVEGTIALGGGRLEFRNTQMKLADGLFSLTGEIKGLRDNEPDMNLQAKLENTDVQKVFHAFENFGQLALRQENLEGRLSAEIKFKSLADANYDLNPDSMQGEISLKMEEGSLIKLPALDSINNILFRNRDLSHIEFATMENTFRLSGRELEIERFHVPSSVLTFSVQGKYGLSGETPTNVLFEVPLANLFRKELSRDALQKIEQGDGGPNILIRAETDEEDGDLRFRWVLSNKEGEQ